MLPNNTFKVQYWPKHPRIRLVSSHHFLHTQLVDEKQLRYSTRLRVFVPPSVQPHLHIMPFHKMTIGKNITIQYSITSRMLILHRCWSKEPLNGDDILRCIKNIREVEEVPRVLFVGVLVIRLVDSGSVAFSRVVVMFSAAFWSFLIVMLHFYRMLQATRRETCSHWQSFEFFLVCLAERSGFYAARDPSGPYDRSRADV